jgi:hypothetical protein
MFSFRSRCTVPKGVSRGHVKLLNVIFAKCIWYIWKKEMFRSVRHTTSSHSCHTRVYLGVVFPTRGPHLIVNLPWHNPNRATYTCSVTWRGKWKWGLFEWPGVSTPVVWGLRYSGIWNCCLMHGYRRFGGTYFLSSRCYFITAVLLCFPQFLHSSYMSYFNFIYRGNAKELRNGICVACIERTLVGITECSFSVCLHFVVLVTVHLSLCWVTVHVKESEN